MILNDEKEILLIKAKKKKRTFEDSENHRKLIILVSYNYKARLGALKIFFQISSFLYDTSGELLDLSLT